MMTVCDINLIATRRAQKQRTIAILRCAVYSLIAILVAIALLYAKIWVATRLVEGQIAVVEGELANPTLADAVERIRFLETNIADYGPRVQLLEKVHDSEQAWINILSDLSVSIPRGVWVTQMTSRRGPQEQSLTFRGSAYNQRDIGQFMLQVEGLKWSLVPNLGYTQANVDNLGKSVIDFEVSVPLDKPIGSDLR
jgi:Tfp pilus assembly protein PilN